MAKIVFLILSVLLIATVALAAKNKEKSCTPWLGDCLTYENCCRHLTCPGYQLRCQPIGGLVIPGKDTRPIGPGPFPPGYIP